ncbi:MAG: extracellular solute-binding protein [Firmicutes bacterium]|nr:extracellular solute-binding protein [Bacillota bacterium]
MKVRLGKVLLGSLLVLVLITGVTPLLAAQKTEIELYYYKQEIVRQMGDMAAAFSRKYPDISIKLTMIPNDNMVTLKARMASGDAPAIIQLQSYAAVYEFAAAGWLVDLTEEPVMSKVVDGAKNAVTYNGRIYALPMDLAGIGIIYNKDIFEKYNLEPPATFDELRSVCATLRRNGVVPFSALLKANWSMGHIISMLHTTLAGDKLLPWMEQMNQGKASFADPVDTRQLFRLLDFYKANLHPNAAEMDQAEQHAAFAAGEAAMMVQGLWAYQACLQINPNLNCGFIPFPVSNNPADNKLFADVDSTFAIAATASPEQKRAAKLFLDWLSTPEAIKMWVEDCKLVPTFKGADVSKMEPPFQDLVRYMNEGKTNPWAFSMYPVAVFEDACKTGAQEYMLGLRDADSVVELIDQTWKREISK